MPLLQLDQMLATARESAATLRPRRRELERLAVTAQPVPSFREALRGDRVALIAEVKRRSPSAGVIRSDLAPAELAATYAAHGAAAVSVLTNDRYFGGSLADLAAVAAAVTVPILRKDFLVSEEQVLEARAAGASAVLLIVRALGAARLGDLLAFARGVGLDALVEVHDRAEAETALGAGARVIGVNSRDLDSFDVDVDRAFSVLRTLPRGCLAVAESGLRSREDVERASLAGADAVLIGTVLSVSDRPGPLTAGLAGVPRRGR